MQTFHTGSHHYEILVLVMGWSKGLLIHSPDLRNISNRSFIKDPNLLEISFSCLQIKVNPGIPLFYINISQTVQKNVLLPNSDLKF